MCASLHEKFSFHTHCLYAQMLDSIGNDPPLTKMTGLAQLVHEKGISTCLTDNGIRKREVDAAPMGKILIKFPSSLI